MAGLAQKLLSLDRRWLFLLVFLGVATPIILPIGLPVTTTGPTRSAYEFVEALPPGSVVLLSFDYGPSSGPENDPMADAFLRQCFVKKLPVVVCALFANGGLTLANNSLARVTAQFPSLRYGVDYVNLGYKDGAAAVLRSLDKDFTRSFPADIHGTPVAQIPIMKGVHSIRDVKVVYSVATGVIGEYWITQMHPQSGTPVIVGPTAVAAPKYYAYLNAGQMVGMVGGMKGAAEYERLLAADHPELAQIYRSTRGFTATKGMDAQTVIHFLIILFILIGNVAYLVTKRQSRSV